MTPLGNYIQINTPEQITKSYFILEKESIMKAEVIFISPDCKVPFKTGQTVYFYTDRHIEHSTGIYLNIEMIAGFIA